MTSKKATFWFLCALLLIVVAVATRIAWPFLRTIASALIVSVIFYPGYQWVLRQTGNRRGWAATITTLGIVFLFLIPATLIVLKATNEAVAVAQRLSQLSAEQGGFTRFVMTLAERPLQFIGRFVDVSKFDVRAAVTSNVQRFSVYVLSSGAAILGNLARFIANFFLMLVVVFFLFRDGQKWATSVGTMIPLSPAQTARLYKNMTDTIIGNVYGIVSVGCAQGLLTGIAVAIAGLASPLLLGLAAFFASIIPVVGAALVWVPAALYLIFTGAVWKGVFVLVWGAVVISTADNIVRPWVVSGKVELHPLVLLFFILGGVGAFGFLGLFLGPVTAAVLVAIFDILQEEASAKIINTDNAPLVDTARVS